MRGIEIVVMRHRGVVAHRLRVLSQRRRCAEHPLVHQLAVVRDEQAHGFTAPDVNAAGLGRIAGASVRRALGRRIGHRVHVLVSAARGRRG